MLISQVLSPVAIKNGIKPAFKYLKQNVTYKEYWEASARYSYFLQKEIGHGLRVGLWMSNCPQVAYCFIALANTKSCTVPLNPGATPDENIYKIKNSGITVMLCSSDHVKTVKEFLHQNGFGHINVIDMESKRCAEYDPSYTAPANKVPNEKDHILLLYTPGTTGKYKGCLFNHTALAQAMTAVKNAYKVLPTDCFFTQGHYSSTFHFLHYLLVPLAGGAMVYISDQTDYKEILTALTEFRVTRMSPNANAVAEMFKYSEAEKLPIVTVKNFSFAPGTQMPKEAWDLVKKHGKIGVISVYGVTEYLGTVAMGNPAVLADPMRPGLTGPALVGTKIRLVDDRNDEIDKKKPQKGQILVMGPGLMDKYLELPEDQKMNIRGTWLFTGDLVEIDGNGNVIFQDRKADVVSVVEGKKVFAKDVEPIVRQIPQVEEVAYVQVRDPMKKPHSAVVIVRKAQTVLNEKEVREFVSAKLAADKRPDKIFFVDAMPRTASGAINRAKLRSLFDGV